jgi:hypothetical protein
MLSVYIIPNKRFHSQIYDRSLFIRFEVLVFTLNSLFFFAIIIKYEGYINPHPHHSCRTNHLSINSLIRKRYRLSPCLSR